MYTHLAPFLSLSLSLYLSIYGALGDFFFDIELLRYLSEFRLTVSSF